MIRRPIKIRCSLSVRFSSVRPTRRRASVTASRMLPAIASHSRSSGSSGNRPDRSDSTGSSWGIELGVGGTVQVRPCDPSGRRNEVWRVQPVLADRLHTRRHRGSGQPDSNRSARVVVDSHYGHFLANTKRRPLARQPQTGPRVVEVLDSEEKGSDDRAQKYRPCTKIEVMVTRAFRSCPLLLTHDVRG